MHLPCNAGLAAYSGGLPHRVPLPPPDDPETTDGTIAARLGGRLSCVKPAADALLPAAASGGKPSVMAKILRASLPHSLRRFAVTLGLFGLLFQVLLPVTQNGIRAAQAANGIEQVVLCSALGFRTIALKDGLPADADPEKPSRAAENCPACLNHAQLDQAILPVGIRLAVPTLSLTALYGAASDSTPAQSIRQPHQARAPPVFRS